MSNFVPRPNSGTLWPNNKASENHPDVRGDVFLDRTFLKNALASTDEDLIKIQVAGWRKEIAGKKCLSLSLSEPYVKKESSQNKGLDSDDVPF
jgi:hypothetical protein